jgi:hypothetical protein
MHEMQNDLSNPVVQEQAQRFETPTVTLNANLFNKLARKYFGAGEEILDLPTDPATELTISEAFFYRLIARWYMPDPTPFDPEAADPTSPTEQAMSETLVHGHGIIDWNTDYEKSKRKDATSDSRNGQPAE